MLRITVELVSHGFESMKKKIGECIIVNDATGTKEIGHYEFVIKDKDNQKMCQINDFKRLERDVWELVYEGLHKIYGEVDINE
jgi:hypothetical protein